MIHDTLVSLFFKHELLKMHPGMRITQVIKLAHLIATMIQTRSPNLYKLAANLPHTSKRRDTRYQWIWRFLHNRLVVPNLVMRPFARKILRRAARRGRRIVLIIDQSQASRLHRHEAVMVSVRVGGRALPLFWWVKRTAGGIGWREQREILKMVLGALPEGAKPPVLMGDRFYGSVEMIGWLEARGWGYRLRLKENLVVFEDGGEITLRECARIGEHELADVLLTRRQVRTNIGIIHEKGHEEPWIIAMDCRPGKYKTLDYGMRWGIEAMFSDLKTRGFNVEESHLEDPDRLSRLLLVMALALYWAVSTGMHEAAFNKTANEKRAPEDRSANHLRSQESLMSRGLRRLQHVVALACAGIEERIPRLFEVWLPDGP